MPPNLQCQCEISQAHVPHMLTLASILWQLRQYNGIVYPFCKGNRILEA